MQFCVDYEFGWGSDFDEDEEEDDEHFDQTNKTRHVICTICHFVISLNHFLRIAL